MLQGEHFAILFRPPLSYHLSLRSLFCLFLSGCLRQVLLCFMSLKIVCTLWKSVDIALFAKVPINPLYTGDSQMSTWANRENPEKMPQNATFHGFTPDRRQSKMLILSTNVDQKSLETIFDCHLSPDCF